MGRVVDEKSENQELVSPGRLMRHVHFIGIGGIGVSGLAQLALKKGERVSGSDLKSSPMTYALELRGAKIFIGHKPENIQGADLVVFSSAIKQDNSELRQALAKGIRVLRRAEFLNELMADCVTVTVTGAHGKTTTSSLAAKLLDWAGFAPTVALGGILCEEEENARLGESGYFVAEADESDGTFLCYHPSYSIITNIDEEHMDFYKTRAHLLEAYARFIAQTKDGGCVFYCADDPVLSALVLASGVRSLGYGLSDHAELRAEVQSVGQCRLVFRCFLRGDYLGEALLPLAGEHNILNALAVVGLGLELGIAFEAIVQALGSFRGVARRFQIKLDSPAIFVVDDYAHHPTEIKATIRAARACPRKRLIVVFQPHRYSRTKLLLDRFAESFVLTDRLVITDIYAAGEEPLPGVTSLDLVDKIRQRTGGTGVDYVGKDQIVFFLKNLIQEDDFVLFLGAGDISGISDEFAKSYQKAS